MLQRDLPALPKTLQRHVEPYEAMRAGSDKNWPEYRRMLAQLRDDKLTLKDIGDSCGVSRERMRQVCNERFPGVRPDETRRAFGNRSVTSKRDRMECERAERSKMFGLLKKHAKVVGFRLGVAWDGDKPHVRVVLYQGEEHYVMWLRSLARLSGNGLYIHAVSPPRELFEKRAGLLILADATKGDLKVSKLYRISTEEFLAVSPSHIVIRQNVRCGNGGGPKAAIQWNRRHLVSKLA